MPVKGENKLYSLVSLSPDEKAHQAALAAIGQAVSEIEINYESEVSKVEENFDLFALEHQKTYERYEQDFVQVLKMVDQEYAGLFKALDEDFVAHRQKLEQNLSTEDESYQNVVKSFEDLQADAFKTYQEMCDHSEASISKESEIHQKFVDEKNEEFEATKDRYSLINNKQYDILLWTMEKSKNGLNQLSKQLNEQAFNDTKFMNQAVMKILEGLRDTKNKITALFKTTTLGYAEKKLKIDELSEIRQIPYSEINQTLIDQYVKQITAVNQKKINFDRIVREDFLNSTQIVGKRIIEADAAKNPKQTQKHILQYGIIKTKSDYLLKRNQELADLLISKYQNEIRKIKVDSFRRVEEIKLAYSLPSQFFQNSINLYSSFAFYVSESLDEIDNMLSDLLRFDQNITQTFVDYLKSSAKTFEDYKINCLVTVNNVTTKMTDLVTNIDRFSRDIISLESNNHLEIANVKKQMENADITGDYQKFLAGLDNDRQIADFQHSMNVKKHQSAADAEAGLLVVQREVTEKNRQKQVDETQAKHQRLINHLEKDIHDSAYDHELAQIEAKYRRDLALAELAEKRQLQEESLFVLNRNLLLKKSFEQQLAVFEEKKAAGSEFVVDFVNQTQQVLDVHKEQVAGEREYLTAEKSPRAFAYLLECRRENVHDHVKFRTRQLTDPHEKAIEYFDHLLYSTRTNIEKRIGRYLLYLKHRLANLNESTALIQCESLSLEHYYRYDILTVVRDCQDTVSSLISPDKNAELSEKAAKLFTDDFKKITILTTATEKNCLINLKSRRGLSKSLLSFYVQMILLLQEFLGRVQSVLDELEESLIRNDVLSMKKFNDDMAAKLRIIDSEFDEAVYHAARKKPHPQAAFKTVELDSRELETRLADRVYQLNQTYLDGLNEQQRFIRYLDRQLTKEGARNLQNKQTAVAGKQKAALNIMRAIEASHSRRIGAYETLKKSNSAVSEEANRLEEARLKQLNTSRAEALAALNQTVGMLPQKNDQLVVGLEKQKTQFIEQRKTALKHELSHLEEQKFVSRPAFLTNMAEIRARLPQDFVSLYKQIAGAEGTFVKEFQAANDLYSAEYERFLGNQVEYNNILFNNSIILHPYEKYLTVADKVKIKTDEVFQDTLNKSTATIESMKKQAVESEDNQNRIINA